MYMNCSQLCVQCWPPTLDPGACASACVGRMEWSVPVGTSVAAMVVVTNASDPQITSCPRVRFAEAFNRSELFWSPVVFLQNHWANSTKRATNYVDADKTTFKKIFFSGSAELISNKLGIRHQFKFVQTIGRDFIQEEIIRKCKEKLPNLTCFVQSRFYTNQFT